ncbi:NAD(P)H-Hydrate epimerase [Hyphodiscus hymeniophilus]|uniref:NAD(P)H-hydrate epimerase n=1 Tax=Hyphodiscus hymeniophilus TaxID=353542 RepID=A0A9P6SPF5_9HELO|nr:NAD(P)H-Hydrate epimerase [Hyphodiscus hymeniophilus]
MSIGAFSIDQLMELAGLSVSQAVYRVHPPSRGRRVLVACGPGNNDDFPTALKETDHIVDSIFGFSFSGEVREPFPAVIKALEETKLPVTAVDAPSSWNIESGPPSDGPGASFMPEVLVSLTAPKPLVKYFKGRHFIGGRFVSPDIAEKYDLELPTYEGVDQIAECPCSDPSLSIPFFVAKLQE